MLIRASVQDIRTGKISRASGLLVVVMRFYPRFVKRELVDRYVRTLAPEGTLFSEFKTLDRKIKNHNSAFFQVNYESRFDLNEEGLEELKSLSKRAENENVFLICQCRDYERCHCDLLLLWAESFFLAPIKPLIFEYSVFKEKLNALRCS
jgi:uncharacterized protein YeaO (DUF488 family)